MNVLFSCLLQFFIAWRRNIRAWRQAVCKCWVVVVNTLETLLATSRGVVHDIEVTHFIIVSVPEVNPELKQADQVSITCPLTAVSFTNLPHDCLSFSS